MTQPTSEPFVDDEGEPEGLPTNWRFHLGLFLVTLVSVFLTGAASYAPTPVTTVWGADWCVEGSLPGCGIVQGVAVLASLAWHGLKNIHHGWSFAIPLMTILVTHEFGHYFAALYHKVPASLPYFIPLPILSPFGTMGAVISMPSRIRSRNALLDIGAAGPIAGMVVAIPVLVVGLMHSEVKPIQGGGFMEGQCLLYSLLKYLSLGPIPPGHDVYLSPTALAGWAGLLVTMLNLLPISQLDGGHVAYALFEEKQNRYGQIAHYSLLGWFAYNFIRWNSTEPGMVWGVWFVLLFVLKRASGGVGHPPTEPGELSPGRKAIAVGTLVLFVLLFMPTPLRQQALVAETFL